MLKSPRVKVRRKSDRGAYDAPTIHGILDDGFICHVGFVLDGQPYVIPTLYTRVGETLYLHGSHVSRMLRTLAHGVDVCVTVTLVDGLVLARSAFHSSINYRSVVILGNAYKVVNRAELDAALHALVEQVMPGRADGTRMPNETELKATTVIALPLREASAKIRTGPPKDHSGDYDLPFWAGVVPLQLQSLPPIPDPDLPDGIPVPDYIHGRISVD